MELVFNLIWVALAGATFVALGVRVAMEPASETSFRRARRIALVLGCILAVLFPIISISDDMATDPVALVEWSVNRRVGLVSLVLQRALSLALAFVLVLPVVEHVSGAVRLACVSLAFLPALVVLSPSTASVCSFRAPPSRPA